MSRGARIPLLSLLLVAVALPSFPQANPSESKRAYRRSTISRGSPARPLTGPAAGRPADLALGYMREHGAEADLDDADVADVVVTSETKGKPSGISHVYLRQRVNGLEVSGADSNFNIRGDGAVLSFGTSFLPDIGQSINRSAPVIGAAAGAAAAAAHVGLAPAEPLGVVEVRGGPEQETVLTSGAIAASPIIAKLVYQPVDIRDLRLAWQIDIDEISGQHLWRITVDAETGEVLNQEDYVVEDNWDVPSGRPVRPADEPRARRTPGNIMMMATPTPVFDGSIYRVFAQPKESPNDGPQTIVQNPADATASPYG